MRYQRCKYFEEGNCFSMGKRNGLNTLSCEGYDRCEDYEVESKVSRIDAIGANGNDGEVYLVEKIARAICGEAYADQVLAGVMEGKRRWETHITQAMRVVKVIKDV